MDDAIDQFATLLAQFVIHAGNSCSFEGARKFACGFAP
jgi:hypothetical protein